MPEEQQEPAQQQLLDLQYKLQKEQIEIQRAEIELNREEIEIRKQESESTRVLSEQALNAQINDRNRLWNYGDKQLKFSLILLLVLIVATGALFAYAISADQAELVERIIEVAFVGGGAYGIGRYRKGREEKLNGTNT